MRIYIDDKTYKLSDLSDCLRCPFFDRNCPNHQSDLNCKSQFWHFCEPLSVFKL